MIYLVIALLLALAGAACIKLIKGQYEKEFRIGGWTLQLVAFLLAVSSVFVSVPAGHVKVATLFGEVQDQYYNEGLHIVNPLYQFTTFDTRQKTRMETAGVPSEDKLITDMDISVQYRAIAQMTPEILRNTGSREALIQVHLVPKLRSVLREQGKGVKESQDFFKEDVQKNLQSSLKHALVEYLAPHGMQIDDVLIRQVMLPKVNWPVSSTSNQQGMRQA